jgi:hypothetical protein
MVVSRSGTVHKQTTPSRATRTSAPRVQTAARAALRRVHDMPPFIRPLPVEGLNLASEACRLGVLSGVIDLPLPGQAWREALMYRASTRRQTGRKAMVMVSGPRNLGVSGHAFVSYVREDAGAVDRLQRVLRDAGIPVWLDRSDLWPGEDWQAKIRQAITDNALVFVACFSSSSLGRVKSYQNEELVVAVEQLRLRQPEQPWLIPVRFDDCEIPDRDIGGGRRFSSLQRVDLFGNSYDDGAARLVEGIRRILGVAGASHAGPGVRGREDDQHAHDHEAQPGQAEDLVLTSAPGLSQDEGLAFTAGWRYTSDGFEAAPLMNMVSTSMPGYPGSDEQSPFVRVGVCVACEPVDRQASSSRIGSGLLRFLSEDPVAALTSSLTQARAGLPWVRQAGHGAIRLEATRGETSEAGKPAASAMLLPPVAGLQTHGRREGIACLWLHFEPRGPDGAAARPASLVTWNQRLRLAVLLAAGFTEFLAADLGLVTHDEPAARIGVLLNAAHSMTELVDAGALRTLPGAVPSRQFLGYAIAENAGQPARDISRTMLAQLCEYTLHLADFEPVIDAL